MAKYKVLMVLNRLNLGGPIYNAAYLSKYIGEEYETVLLSGKIDESEASAEHILDRVDVQVQYVDEMYRSIHPIKDHKSYRQIRAFIKEYKPDIVHTQASKAGALGRLAAIHEQVPVVMHTFHGHVFHGYFNPLKTMVFKWIERYLSKRSQAIVAISELQKEDLVNKHKVSSSEQTHVIPIGLDLSKFYENREENRKKFRERYGLKEGELAIGIVGRIVPVKNHSLFMELIKAFNDKHPGKIKALVIGDGESGEEIRAYARELGFEHIDDMDCQKSDMVFTSWIKEMEEVCSGLDIIALTSNNEGTPVSLIEAQAAGKAVISTDVGGVSDTVIKGETALLSEVGNLSEMLRNLEELVENEDLRHKMGKKGEEWVKERYSYQRLVSDFRKLYLKLLKD